MKKFIYVFDLKETQCCGGLFLQCHNPPATQFLEHYSVQIYCVAIPEVSLKQSGHLYKPPLCEFSKLTFLKAMILNHKYDDPRKKFTMAASVLTARLK